MLVAYYYICNTLWRTNTHLPTNNQNTNQPESISPATQTASSKSRTKMKNMLSAKSAFQGNNKSSNLQVTQCNGDSEASSINRYAEIYMISYLINSGKCR